MPRTPPPPAALAARVGVLEIETARMGATDVGRDQILAKVAQGVEALDGKLDRLMVAVVGAPGEPGCQEDCRKMKARVEFGERVFWLLATLGVSGAGALLWFVLTGQP